MNLLHLAVSQNYYQIVKMLLDSDFPIFREAKNGMTAFHIAVLKGLTPIVELMIDWVKEHLKPKQLKKLINKLNS